MLDLMEMLAGGRPMPFVFYGDNQATLEIIRSGKNTSMRHFQRQHGINLSFLHEHAAAKLFRLLYCVTDRQCGDIFTKHCVDAGKWSRLLPQIGHYQKSAEPAPWAPKTKPKDIDHDKENEKYHYEFNSTLVKNLAMVAKAKESPRDASLGGKAKMSCESNKRKDKQTPDGTERPSENGIKETRAHTKENCFVENVLCASSDLQTAHRDALEELPGNASGSARPSDAIRPLDAKSGSLCSTCLPAATSTTPRSSLSSAGTSSLRATNTSQGEQKDGIFLRGTVPESTKSTVQTGPSIFDRLLSPDGLAGAVQRQAGAESVRHTLIPSPSGYVAPNLLLAEKASHALPARDDPEHERRGQSPGKEKVGTSLGVRALGLVILPSEFTPELVLNSKIEYVLIEFCCSSTSRIGAACPPGAIVIRCTGENGSDVLNPAVRNMLRTAVQVCGQCGVPVCLWGSTPCTGGSQWQIVNRVKYGVTAKLQQHWKLFRKLWKAFEEVASTVLRGNGLVANEWPLRCAYWHDRQASRFMATFDKAVINGCAYNMRPVGAYAEDQFIGKAWRVASSDKDFALHLDRRCQGGHRHVHAAGDETEPSGLYPQALAERVHSGAQRFAAKARRMPEAPTW